MYWLGIDLGGTNIATGIVDENYKIIGTGKEKTDCSKGPEKVADDMAIAVENAIKDAGIDRNEIVAMGIGSPGAIDPKTGTVLVATNLGFNNVPLCQMMKERTGFDFYIENDANAAAYGELIAGAGRGKKDFIAITLGTGVGGGIIIDGKIYSGFNHAGGELGHTVIVSDGEQCSCGRKGCWEAYASATGLIRQTKAAMLINKDSKMWEVSKNIDSGNGITAFKAMRMGDETAKSVVKQYIDYVAEGLINMVNIFQPEVFCIGGGISKEGDTLLDPIKEFAAKNSFTRNLDIKTEYKVAELGNDAGIIGAALLCNLYK